MCECSHFEAMALGAFLMMFLLFSLALLATGNGIEVGYGSKPSKKEDDDE